jgi:hypothetical protein
LNSAASAGNGNGWDFRIALTHYHKPHCRWLSSLGGSTEPPGNTVTKFGARIIRHARGITMLPRIFAAILPLYSPPPGRLPHCVRPFARGLSAMLPVPSGGAASTLSAELGTVFLSVLPRPAGFNLLFIRQRNLGSTIFRLRRRLQLDNFSGGGTASSTFA